MFLQRILQFGTILLDICEGGLPFLLFMDEIKIQIVQDSAQVFIL
jgi:hypothetical protein